MSDLRRSRRWTLACCCAVVAAGLLATAPGAAAHGKLNWKACGDPEMSPRPQCATVKVPRDYDHPKGPTLSLAIAKAPATGKKIGSLFFNFGGPGAFTAPYVEFNGPDLFPALNQRFDIVGLDPRGTDIDTGIDCKVNQETDGIYSEPFTTPFNLNRSAFVKKVSRYVSRCASRNADILPYASTANDARDMDLARGLVGDSKLSYLGFSYGTFLGATYASLFPGKMRAVVLDGPIDADQYINNPMQGLREQSAGFERAIGRFFQACAADQENCSGFGGNDPWGAYDELVDEANATPIPAPGYAPDPRPITGDDILNVTIVSMYSKLDWGPLARMLSEAAAGDGTRIRTAVDEDVYGRDPATGEYDPASDRYFTLGAIEQKYRRGDVDFYLDAGDACWGMFDHVWSNCGYVELNYGLWPIRGRDVFGGPFSVPKSASTPLVVDTTYDPATPYRGGQRLARDLGNARLLTMRGDGHTAYETGSPDCIDPAIENYLISKVLPPKGKRCKQEVPFTKPEDEAARKRSTSAQELRIKPHTRPLPRR
jgi:pimeloyl-ACP methyl ester carboxylesterase